MKRVLIAGYYGFRNTGDEAILASILADLHRAVPGSESVVVSGDPASTTREHGVAAILFTDIPALVDAAQSADLVVVGGGGIFHDFWRFDADALLSPAHGGLAFFSGMALLAALCEKPLVIWGVGVGPLDTDTGRLFTRAAFEQADAATVRDAESKRLLESIGVDRRSVTVAADPAFRLPLEAAATSTPRTAGSRLGIALRNWELGVAPDVWEKKAAEAIDLFLDRHADAEAVFLPFQDEPTGILDDLALADRLRASLRHSARTRVENPSLSPAAKAAAIGSCDVLLAMRLHAVVFGIRAGVPTVPIAYDPKVESLAKTAGLEAFSQTPAELDGRNLAARLDRALAERTEISKRLAKTGADLAERAGDSVRDAARLLESAPLPRPMGEAMRSLASRAALSRSLAAARLAVFSRPSPASASTAPAEGGLRIPAAKGFDVVCFPIIDWGFRFQRPQQLLSRFADAGHRVFYLRTGLLGLEREPAIETLRDRVFELALPGEARYDVYSERLAGESLEQALAAMEAIRERCEIADAVCFVEYPGWEPLARALADRHGWKLVYDCLDDHAGFGTHGEATVEDEAKLVEESDLVVATSANLFDRLRARRADVQRLANAGDASRFESLPDRSASPWGHLPSPVIGYYGAVSAWFDVDSVGFAARRHPEWSFLIVGDARGGNLEPLERLANVHRTGEVPYRDLPAVTAAFDVCTIPFQRTPLTEATDPVKLYEYLATGKPVVARRLPEIERFADVVRLYDKREDFVKRLEEAVSEADPELAIRRRKIARENTWEERYENLSRWISETPARPRAAVPSVQPPGTGAETVDMARHRESVSARAREIRRLNEQVDVQQRGIEFLRGELSVKDNRIAALDKRVVAMDARIGLLEEKMAEGHDFVEALNEERQATVGALNADLHRAKVESEERRHHLEYAVSELMKWENSIFGTGRHAVQRLKRAPGAARRRLGKLTAPGTVPYEIGVRVLPRPAARWLRRRIAPVAQPPRFVPGEATMDAAWSDASHDTGGLPEIPEGKPDVVVLSIIDWDFRFQRPQQLAAQFGRHGHRVFYLSTSKYGEPEGPPWRLARKAGNVAELVLRSARPLDIYAGKLEEEDLAALESAFDRLAADLAVGDAVVLVEIPFWKPLADRLRRRFGWKIAYDCMDEWTNFPGFGEGVLALEEGLVRTADATVVSADKLVEKWKGKARRLVLARNGIDADHYRRLYRENRLLAGLPHPVIGYYGALASWVDVRLLEKIARRHPEASVVLAGGHFDVNLSPLKKLPNVHLLGQRPYEEMPQLLFDYDVCMIPFLVNDITEATNPVKFYEYLFGGKPVVSPALTELLPFERLAYLARGHDDFLAKLDAALAEPKDDPRREERRKVAEGNDWSARYEAIESGVSEAYPLVSLVVVSYGGLELTRACLESVLERETWRRLEVLAVDNDSTDETPAYLKELAARDPRVKVQLNAENRGFAAANNQGVAMSSGELVILLNNDTVVPPGMIGRLVAHLERDRSIGLLCPTTNFCGNEAKVDPEYATLEDMPKFAAHRAETHRGKVFDIGVAAMYCVAIRRAVLDEIGPLDEAYGVGMFEDDDFAIRTRNAGYRVACAEDVFVHHVGQGSFAKLPPEEYDRIWKRNQAYFEKKWGRRWKAHVLREGVGTIESKVGAE